MLVQQLSLGYHLGNKDFYLFYFILFIYLFLHGEASSNTSGTFDNISSFKWKLLMLLFARTSAKPSKLEN